MITKRLQGLCAVVLVLCSVSVAEAQERCAAPALAFITGSDLHVSTAVASTAVGRRRISLAPTDAPPDDAFVPFEGHPGWGRVATALIIKIIKLIKSDAELEYVSSDDLSEVPTHSDYFVIYLEKAAPAGSEFADYVFHSNQGLAAGYHLVHAEAEYTDPWEEPTIVYTVVDIDQPIPNNFQLGAIPPGVNP